MAKNQNSKKAGQNGATVQESAITVPSLTVPEVQLGNKKPATISERIAVQNKKIGAIEKKLDEERAVLNAMLKEMKAQPDSEVRLSDLHKHMRGLKAVAPLIAIFALGFFLTSQGVDYAVNAEAGVPVVLAPQRGLDGINVPDWVATNAVAQGRLIKANKQQYFVLTGGTTSTNVPTHKLGSATNGTALLLAVSAKSRGTDGVRITQEADGASWYQRGQTSSTNGGEFAYLKGQQYVGSGDNAVSVWPAESIKYNVSDD